MSERVCDVCNGSGRLPSPGPIIDPSVLRMEGITDAEWDAFEEALQVPDSLDAAWAEAEAALPEGWRPATVGPADPDAYDEAGNPISAPWVASVVSPAFFDGENDREWACGSGPTPAAALRALAAKLREAGR